MVLGYRHVEYNDRRKESKGHRSEYFQSVGPYTNENNEVFEPWQGRNIVISDETTDESVELDRRFDLGTYTENNRDHWEVQTVNPITRRSQFQSEDLKTARASVKNELVISDEVNWSVDTFPFTINENNETVPLYFYYDKDLHPEEYSTAVNGKVNLRIELREDGRTSGIMDNFQPRLPYRPFFLGLNQNTYGTPAGGVLIGGGAFNFNDRIRIEAIANDDSHFVMWSDGESEDTISTNNVYSFLMPQEDLEIIGNFRLNTTIRMVAAVNGTETEAAGTVWFGRSDEYPTEESELTNTLNVARQIHNFYSDEPINNVIPDEGTSNLSIGTTRGHDNVFILTDRVIDQDQSDPDYTVYEYTWGPNIQDLEAYPELEQSLFSLSIPDTIYEQNTYRPNEIIKLYTEPSSVAFAFVNYTYLDQDGNLQEIPDPYTGDSSDAELILADQYTTGSVAPIIEYTGPKGVHTLLSPFDYPGGVLQIYANYVAGYFRVRSYNRWKNSYEQNRAYRLRYGYGQVNINQETVSTELEYSLGTALSIRAIPAAAGYELGEFFFWPGSGATIEFDQEILNTFTDDDQFIISDSPTYSQGNDQVRQITLVDDTLTYIGHKFRQEGVYVRVSRGDNSFNFSINRLESEGEGSNFANIIREASISEEVGANMFELGGDEIQWSLGVNSSEGGDPIIQDIIYWNDSANSLVSIEPSIESFSDFGVELNGNMLTYTTPNNVNSDDYYKYIEIIVYSEPL